MALATPAAPAASGPPPSPLVTTRRAASSATGAQTAAAAAAPSKTGCAVAVGAIAQGRELAAESALEGAAASAMPLRAARSIADWLCGAAPGTTRRTASRWTPTAFSSAGRRSSSPAIRRKASPRPPRRSCANCCLRPGRREAAGGREAAGLPADGGAAAAASTPIATPAGLIAWSCAQLDANFPCGARRGRQQDGGADKAAVEAAVAAEPRASAVWELRCDEQLVVLDTGSPPLRDRLPRRRCCARCRRETSSPSTIQTKPARPRLLQRQPCGLALLSNAAVARHARAARDRLAAGCVRIGTAATRQARRCGARGAQRPSAEVLRHGALRPRQPQDGVLTVAGAGAAVVRRWTWPPSGARGSSSFASTTARASPRSAHARSRRWSSPAAPTARSRRSTPARRPQRQRFCALRARPAPRLPR